jgi:hypothetical protein
MRVIELILAATVTGPPTMGPIIVAWRHIVDDAAGVLRAGRRIGSIAGKLPSSA